MLELRYFSAMNLQLNDCIYLNYSYWILFHSNCEMLEHCKTMYLSTMNL